MGGGRRGRNGGNGEEEAEGLLAGRRGAGVEAAAAAVPVDSGGGGAEPAGGGGTGELPAAGGDNYKSGGGLPEVRSAESEELVRAGEPAGVPEAEEDEAGLRGGARVRADGAHGADGLEPVGAVLPVENWRAGAGGAGLLAAAGPGYEPEGHVAAGGGAAGSVRRAEKAVHPRHGPRALHALLARHTQYKGRPAQRRLLPRAGRRLQHRDALRLLQSL